MGIHSYITQGLFTGLLDTRYIRCSNKAISHSEGQVCQYCQYKTNRPLPLSKTFKLQKNDHFFNLGSNMLTTDTISDLNQENSKKTQIINTVNKCNRYSSK